MENNQSYSIDILREYDPDRYISTYFAPKEKQAALLTLYTFFQDIQKIPDLVSEPILGEIRFQWWRDILNQGDGKKSGNPLADGLFEIIEEYDLPKMRLIAFIDATSFLLSGELMPDEKALQIYLNKTFGTSFYISGCILDPSGSKHINEFALEAGQAYGLAMLLKSIPNHLSKGRLFLPADKLKQYNIDMEKVFSGEETQGLRELIREFCTVSENQYKKLSTEMHNIPDTMHSSFLPIALISSYIKQLKSKDHKVLRNVSQINPLYRLWRYWRASAFGAF